MTTPLTVCVSVFNEEQRIERCLTSLQQQTFTDFKVVVLDNASTDRTVEIATAFAATDPRFSVRAANLINVGPIQNFQRCFWLAETEFVMQASGNDHLEPRYIEAVMNALRSDQDAGVAYTHMSDGDPAVTSFSALELDPVERATLVMSMFTSGHVLYGIFRRKIIDACAPLAHRMGADHIFVAEASLYGGIKCVAEPLYHRTSHDGRDPKTVAKLCSDYAHRLIEPLAPFDTDIGVIPPYLEMISGHLEMFDRARIPTAAKQELKARCIRILGARFKGAIFNEINAVVQDGAKFVNHAAVHGFGPMERLRAVAMLKAVALAEIAVPEMKPYVASVGKLLAQILNSEQ